LLNLQHQSHKLQKDAESVQNLSVGVYL